MNDFHVVLDQDHKVVGFNLTDKEKDAMFYSIDTGGGHKKPAVGWAWTGIPFEADCKEEVQDYIDRRGVYLSTTKNGWKDIAHELYKELNDTYNELKRTYADDSPIVVRLRKAIIKAEDNGIHLHGREEV